MSGDQIAALVGLVLALILIGTGGAFRHMPASRRLTYGLIWAGVFVAGAAVAAWLSLSLN